jgi:uncharacterized membrane protein
MERTEKSIEIDVPVEVAFALYSDFERFPEWMKHIKEVRRTGENLTRWEADAPLGINVEWEAEITAFEANQKIAWRTVRGDVHMEGEVTFEPVGKDKTLLRISVGYSPPAGHLGAIVAKFLGSDPEKEIEEELKRFAKLAEEQSGMPGKDRTGRSSKASGGTAESRAA